MAFGTTASFSSGCYTTTRCTRSTSGRANTFQAGMLLSSGTVFIERMYVQRYYTEPVPV